MREKIYHKLILPNPKLGDKILTVLLHQYNMQFRVMLTSCAGGYVQSLKVITFRCHQLQLLKYLSYMTRRPVMYVIVSAANGSCLCSHFTHNVPRNDTQVLLNPTSHIRKAPSGREDRR